MINDNNIIIEIIINIFIVNVKKIAIIIEDIIKDKIKDIIQLAFTNINLLQGFINLDDIILKTESIADDNKEFDMLNKIIMYLYS